MSEPVSMTQMDFLAATHVEGLDEAVGSLKLLKKAEGVKKAEARDTVRKVKTCCRACIANCGVIATVKNGRVVKLEGNPEDRMSKGRMCAKGLSGIQALYHPNRNKYPMMRVGKRGENKWRRISWEKAIDIIAHKLMETREKYGAEAVFCSTGGGAKNEMRSNALITYVLDTRLTHDPA